MAGEEDKDKQKNKFQNINDILKMEGDTPFDADEAARELEEAEKRKAQLAEIKKKLEEIKAMPNTDDYMNTVLRELVTKGMVMLESLQQVVEETPRGRDVETAAAMMSAINSVIDNINKIKVFNAKIDIEKEKLSLKKASTTNLPGGMTANQNVFMVGTTSELMEMLTKKDLVPNNNKMMKDIKADSVQTSPADVEMLDPDDKEDD